MASSYQRSIETMVDSICKDLSMLADPTFKFLRLEDSQTVSEFKAKMVDNVLQYGIARDVAARMVERCAVQWAECNLDEVDLEKANQLVEEQLDEITELWEQHKWPIVNRVRVQRTWEEKDSNSNSMTWIHSITGLAVIASIRREQDERLWLHVSCSHARPPRHLPSFEELGHVKDVFIGRDAKAIQVFPKAEEYVNINPMVLHLWHCLDEDLIPDFTWGTKSI